MVQVRAFIEPVTYEGELATSWMVRIWENGDPAENWAEKKPHDGLCMILREKIDEVSIWGLTCPIDLQAARDIKRSMMLSGIKKGDWTRARDYHGH